MGDPSENFAPLKKRRRRWPILVPFLLVVAIFAWWYYPRGDARFVGTWEFQAVRLNVFSTHFNPKPNPLFQFELMSNGTAVVRSISTSGDGKTQVGRPRYTRWQLGGDSLVIGNPDKRPVNRFLAAFAKFISRQLSINLMFDSGFRFTVVDIEPNEVGVGASGISALLSHSRLVRLPE